ncbi:FxsA family protein [Natronolimnobius baerhuensis]|uniref:Membrane protein FxsA n=1 Tax=Natronolimnobius baerhuensis TaxID=253108 RepID=A0A202E6I3_9EURY|nr:FxsA family protein [Natronolimnobius baerhuensis]OVE83886.1 membrane protein FxsA [Natronolimnobius baerhuensis]
MLRWILALLFIPFLDAVLLAIVVSQTSYLGWVGMVLLVVLTGLVGMLFVRMEGRRTLGKMQQSLAQGQPPTNELLDGGLLIAAGAFLLTPGLVTDAIGFMLVLPITRIPIRAGLKRFVIVPYADKKTDGLASGVVWTYGFPDEDAPGSATGTAGSSSAGTAGSSGTAGTYDLGSDSYTVEGENDSSERYRVDLGDGSTHDADEDSESDDGDGVSR